MIVNIRKAFQENVNGLKWMDKLTIDAVQDKVCKNIKKNNLINTLKTQTQYLFYLAMWGGGVIYFCYFLRGKLLDGKEGGGGWGVKETWC